MAKNKKEIETQTHSEDLEDIISKPPSWLLKRGTAIVLLIILMMISLSAIIRYPDTLTGKMVFVSDNSSIVRTPTSGNVILLVEDGSEVSKDQIIAYIQSTANHDHVFQLLDILNQSYSEEAFNGDWEQIADLKLGQLGSIYESLKKAYRNYLQSDGGINEKAKLISVKDKMIEEIEMWKQQYIMIAPHSGSVNYIWKSQKHQYMIANEQLLYVNLNPEDIYGQMNIHQTDYWRLHVGQKVLIDVNSFPHEKFGYVVGKIEDISKTPIEDGMFRIRVEVFSSNQDSIFQLMEGATAKAKIVLENKSIFDRIIQDIITNLSIS